MVLGRTTTALSYLSLVTDDSMVENMLDSLLSDLNNTLQSLNSNTSKSLKSNSVEVDSLDEKIISRLIQKGFSR